MQSWKQSLDNWLTTPPEDNDSWFEAVEQHMTQQFWDDHIDGFLESELYFILMDKLEVRTYADIDDETGKVFREADMTPKLAAEIVMKFCDIYKIES